MSDDYFEIRAIKRTITYQPGTILWQVPIRFWEEKEPIKLTVIKDEGGLYVYHEHYGHNVYVDKNNVYYQQKDCHAAIALMSLLMDLCFRDDTAAAVDQYMIKDKEGEK